MARLFIPSGCGRLRRRCCAAAAVLALGVSLAAAPFAGPKIDHSLCCPRGYNPLRHEERELSGDGLPDLMPGLQRGADSAVKPEARRAPASIAPASGDPAKAPVPPLPAGPPLAALEGPLEKVAGYAKVHFSQLAGFKYGPPPQPVAAGEEPPDALAPVPAVIRRLDGAKVVLSGFMLPLKLEDGLATEFFLLSNSSLCCYGIMPELNEWMHVRMRGEGLPPVQDVPVFLAGQLRVKARWEGGYLTGIYELEGHGLLKPR
jgi:hypothetical protein